MPLRFTLRQLEYLVAAGETGSVTLAARRLNVSAPSVSAAIAQLEAEFGLPLFVRRHAQGLSPTQGGRRFVEEARGLLAQAAALGDLAAQITAQVRGPLAVGCMTSVAQIILPQLRRGFVARYPDVAFRQTEGSQAALIDGLRADQIDVALGWDMSLPHDLEFTPLVALPPYAVFAPDHPLAPRAVVSVEDLVGYPMVLLDLPISNDHFLSFFTRRGLRPHIAERTADLAVMQSMVANGFGYCIANIRPVSETAPDGKPLCFVPLSGPVPAVRLGLLRIGGAPSTRTVSAFVDHARQTISADKAPGLMLRPKGPA